MRAQMGRLRAEQAALLAPVAESTTKLDGDAAKLRTRRQELIKELDGLCALVRRPAFHTLLIPLALAGIDEQLRGMVDQKAQLQRSVVDIDARFRQQLADLDSQSKGIAAIVGKLDAVPALHASLGRLSSELDTCKAHLKSASRGTTSAAAVISSRADYTDVSLAYLKVEKRCVEFLRQRIASTKEAAAKLQFEIARYEEFGVLAVLAAFLSRNAHCVRAAGMSQVLKDCAASAAKLKAEIAEDVTAVAYLCNEAVSVVRTFRTVVVDDDSVPLHPAELVLHHRLRAVAAAMGILFPLDKDLAGHDFTVVESGMASVLACQFVTATLTLCTGFCSGRRNSVAAACGASC